MALWYDCGNGAVKTSFAKKEVSSHAYIVCPGPSLKDVDSQVFTGRMGITTFGVTTSYPYIKPNIWVGMDRVECYDRRLWWEPFIKICRGNYINMSVEDKLPIKNFYNTYFADCAEPTNREEIFTARAHDVKFVWHKNTLALTLHIAIWMGFKKIHFVGCDLTKSYFDGRMLGVREQYNQRLYDQIYEYLTWFTVAGRNHGVECTSCSAESRLNSLMNYVPLDTAIGNSERVASQFTGYPILHAIDAEKMYKGGGSVVLFDEKDRKDAELFLES